MRKQLSIFFLVFVLIFSMNIFSQDHDYHFLKPIDSIEEMFSHFESSKKVIIANKYLSKAKLINNQIKIINGYFLKSVAHSHTKLAIKYTDSVIESAINIKNNNLLAKGYLHKGIQLYYQSENKKSLYYLLLARNIYDKNNEKYNLLKIKHYLGILKNNSNQEKQALHLFKENIAFFNLDTVNQKKHPSQYFKSLFALADSYLRNNLLDLSLKTNELGLKRSLLLNSNLYPHFLISYGENIYLKGLPKIAIDSIKKSVKYIKFKKKSLSGAYFIISKCYEKLNNTKYSVKYLEKIDSIYQKNPSVIFHARNANLKLYDYHKLNKSSKEQLRVVNKLILIDSIIQRNHSNLYNEITNKYDIPKLVSDKENLISALKDNNNKNKQLILLLSILGFVLLSLIAFFVRKNIIYKKRFNKIMSPQLKKKEEIKINIPENVIKSIIKKLTNFETSNKFIKKKYTLNTLAKEFNTNSSYLSSIINSTKDANFSSYLNNLRIDYAIDKLKKDKKFRIYTIKAIAEEVGFNTSQSFTNAFYKKTRLYPSFFIAKIKKM